MTLESKEKQMAGWNRLVHTSMYKQRFSLRLVGAFPRADPSCVAYSHMCTDMYQHTLDVSQQVEIIVQTWTLQSLLIFVFSFFFYAGTFFTLMLANFLRIFWRSNSCCLLRFLLPFYFTRSQQARASFALIHRISSLIGPFYRPQLGTDWRRKLVFYPEAFFKFKAVLGCLAAAAAALYKKEVN